VFEAGVVAVLAIAVITLHEHDFLRNLDDLAGLTVAHEIACAGIGILAAVKHAATTAKGDIVTDDLVIFHDGDKAKVVGEDIDVVMWRDGDGNLKLTREIGGPVKRL